jgi:uncharacterized delta-60 repeat protein
MKRRSLITLLILMAAAGLAATPAMAGSQIAQRPNPGTLGTAVSSTSNGPGSLDPTFGTGGKVQTNVNPNQVTNVALQSDGKIVVIASLADFKIASLVFGVLRYLPSGALDPAFGNAGIVRTAFTIGFHYPYSVAIQPDGKLVVVGSASSPNNSTDMIAVARYNSNGSLDGSFGSGGKVTTVLLGFRDVAQVVLVQPDGKILIGGLALTCFGRGCGNDTALVRYNANGGLDTTFGKGGSVVTTGIGEVDALGLEADGSVLALDRNGIGTNPVARFDAHGNPQPVALAGTLASISSLYNATFQRDGKIVLGGQAKGPCKRGLRAQVTRRALDDSFDPQFNNPPFFFGAGQCNGQDLVQAVAIASNGKVAVGGIAAMPNFQIAFGVARLNADGSLDQSWGNGGRVTTMFTGRADQVDALAIQPDGKVVAVGLIATDAMGNTAVALTRYLGP